MVKYTALASRSAIETTKLMAHYLSYLDKLGQFRQHSVTAKPAQSDFVHIFLTVQVQIYLRYIIELCTFATCFAFGLC